jgi:hypothetical protein
MKEPVSSLSLNSQDFASFCKMGPCIPWKSSMAVLNTENHSILYAISISITYNPIKESLKSPYTITLLSKIIQNYSNKNVRR